MRRLVRTLAGLGALALAFALIVVGCVPRVPQVAGVALTPGAEPAAGPVAAGGPDAAGGADGAAGTWNPRPDLRFQVQLGGEVRRSLGANVYDLDPFATGSQTVAELRAGGADTMCHLDVGVADPTLPDAERFDPDLAGTPVDAGPASLDPDGRRWLDVRQWDRIAPILTDRLRLCRAKGFQAVDADHGDGYAHRSGFPLTAEDQLAFDRKVAALAHQLGLGVGVRTTVALALRLRPSVDFVVTEGCFDAGTCPDYFAFVDDDKDVFDLEPATPTHVCALARAYGFAASRRSATRDAPTVPCAG